MVFFNFFSRSPKNCNIKPVVLVVLDGWGTAPPSQGNAIYLAKTPFINSLPSNYPCGQLIACGESVGLPANEVGNSEVGHLTIGAGRAILQSLKRIDLAIENGTFFSNNAFFKVANHVRNHNSKLHIMGMASSGRVHSSINHLYALLEFCKRQDISHVYLHLFTDGRDAPPKEASRIINEVEARLKILNLGRICTVSGRYYAMDRDARWDRTKKVYEAVVLGIGNEEQSTSEAIQKAYAKGITDEFIEPTVIIHKGQRVTVDDNDGVIFFNYRIDRPRQLTIAFVLPDFEFLKSFEWGYELDQGTTEQPKSSGPTFKREKWPKNLFFLTMTEYQKNLPVSAIAFGTEAVANTLCEVISQSGLKQIHIAESEKERMLTYYLDGLREERFQGEELRIVASPKVATYDKKPEMSVERMVEESQKYLKKCRYHFMALNFANPDMVAHSGNLPATIRAVEVVDKVLHKLVDEALKYDATIFITADHGNAEELLTYPQSTYYYTSKKGSMNTDHSNNPVPVFIISNHLSGKPMSLPRGALSDVAPTILTLLNLPIPAVMTGINLLK